MTSRRLGLLCALGVAGAAACAPDPSDVATTAPIVATTVPVVPIELHVARVTIDGCGLVPEIATAFGPPGGPFVSTAHSLAGTGPIAVDGGPAEVVALDNRADVAVLRLGAADRDGAALAALAAALRLQAGEVVTVPRWTRDVLVRDSSTIRSVVTIRFTDLVAHTTDVRDGAIVDLTAVGGDSGAPVIGVDGAVVAMIFATAREAEGESFAVSATEITGLLSALSVGDPALAVTRPPC